MVCHNPESIEILLVPTDAMIKEWRGVIPFLTGFENNEKDGTGTKFNSILSNGDRSTQRDEGETYYTHMFPAGSHKMIRSVKIHYYKFIRGFEFFDREGAPLWKIGTTTV